MLEKISKIEENIYVKILFSAAMQLLKRWGMNTIENVFTDINDIKVTELQQNAKIRQEKLSQKEEYFKDHKDFDKPIVLDKDKYIIDGLYSYILAKKIGLLEVKVEISNPGKWVLEGKHPFQINDTIYSWKIDDALVKRIKERKIKYAYAQSGKNNDLKLIEILSIKPVDDHKDSLKEVVKLLNKEHEKVALNKLEKRLKKIDSKRKS